MGEALLQKIPGIKSLYGSIRDLVRFFDASKQNQFDKTVMVTVGDHEMRLTGLVTLEDFTDLPEGIADERTVAVYLPMSDRLGGFTVMVPRDKIESFDMKVDQAIPFVLTAGVSAEDTNAKPPAANSTKHQTRREPSPVVERRIRDSASGSTVAKHAAGANAPPGLSSALYTSTVV